jgi:hypothetical protein
VLGWVVVEWLCEVAVWGSCVSWLCGGCEHSLLTHVILTSRISAWEVIVVVVSWLHALRCVICEVGAFVSGDWCDGQNWTGVEGLGLGAYTHHALSLPGIGWSGGPVPCVEPVRARMWYPHPYQCPASFSQVRAASTQVWCAMVYRKLG